MRLFAALAAFSFHVCFAAALTGDETNMNIGQSVTDSSVQRAQRVTVTNYGDTSRTHLVQRTSGPSGPRSYRP